MQKQILIDGNYVKFKATDDTKEKYRKLLKRNFYRDVKKIKKVIKHNINTVTSPISDLKKVDFDSLYLVCWMLAKNADDNIPNPDKWIKEFENFPVVHILTQLSELVFYSLSGRKRVIL